MQSSARPLPRRALAFCAVASVDGRNDEPKSGKDEEAHRPSSCSATNIARRADAGVDRQVSRERTRSDDAFSFDRRRFADRGPDAYQAEDRPAQTAEDERLTDHA